LEAVGKIEVKNMFNIIDSLGIYTDEIQYASELIENAFRKVLLVHRIDDITDHMRKELPQNMSWASPTDCIIETMFKAADDIICEEYPMFLKEDDINEDLYISYVVDGLSSHFEVHDDDLFYVLKNFGLEDDVVRALAKAEVDQNLGLTTDETIAELKSIPTVFEDFIKIFKNGNDITIYKSVSELGKANLDNAAREDDDTDESFGKFLLKTYKTGNSNKLYFQFPSDGSVIEGAIN